MRTDNVTLLLLSLSCLFTGGLRYTLAGETSKPKPEPEEPEEPEEPKEPEEPEEADDKESTRDEGPKKDGESNPDATSRPSIIITDMGTRLGVVELRQILDLDFSEGSVLIWTVDKVSNLD